MPADKPLIWVIDDDPDVCEHLAMVLSRAGIDAEIRSITNAADTRAALESPGEHPQLVLVDQFLPDALGVSVLGLIRAALPSAAAVVISAAPEEVDLGGLDVEVLTKPVSIRTLQPLLAR